MKDKRLEVKLSVRGDGSLTRSSQRSSTRSNRSNFSYSNSGLPVSEIFTTDRFAPPQHRAFEILDKYRRQPNQYGYPAQSLQALNQYQQPGQNRYDLRYGNNPQDQYPEPLRYQTLQYPPQPSYQPVFVDPSAQIYGTLPRTGRLEYDGNTQNVVNYTLPTKSSLRRVRISEHQPVVYGYGT